MTRSGDVARRWWEMHLPNLSQPLVLAVPAAGTIGPEQHLASAKVPIVEAIV